jgi:hypothetical protein
MTTERIVTRLLDAVADGSMTPDAAAAEFRTEAERVRAELADAVRHIPAPDLYAAVRPIGGSPRASVLDVFAAEDDARDEILSGAYGDDVRLSRVPAGTKQHANVALDEVPLH